MTTDNLTRTEKEILSLILKQKTSPEIAQQRGVSIKAIEMQRTNLLQKTQSRNVVGLVLWATKNGYSE